MLNSNNISGGSIDALIDLLYNVGSVSTSANKQNANINDNTNNIDNNKSLLSDNGIAGLWLYYSLDMNSKMTWYERVFFSDGKSLCVIPRKGLLSTKPFAGSSGERLEKMVLKSLRLSAERCTDI